ncbi:hypothetical protein T4D_7580 [Trichinella pseudospiralis]|uniref:Uncharacterized protein n=1 Tax=Trichinella pseudospiralis TaxID=6337 RepID=A0A0V1FH26_TRIPS|nr:hypothetical protein T4D_7580 [Trichinella pseudospiralis]
MCDFTREIDHFHNIATASIKANDASDEQSSRMKTVSCSLFTVVLLIYRNTYLSTTFVILCNVSVEVSLLSLGVFFLDRIHSSYSQQRTVLEQSSVNKQTIN